MLQIATEVNLPEIHIGTDITILVDQLEEALIRLRGGPHLYQRAHALMMIRRHGRSPKWLRRPPGSPVIVPIEPAYLRELATQGAIWQKYDVRSGTSHKAMPPMWVIDTLYARPGWNFPYLEGIVCSPTLRPDGSILSAPGYDQDTGLYLDLNAGVFPDLIDRPTIDDVRAAIDLLLAVFADFPFAQDCHRSAALAAVLSLVARYAIQGNVPMFGVDATTRGTGKGLLIDGCSVIATGRLAARWPQTTDEEEERKRLLTIALAGDPIIHIDNVIYPLGSAALDSAITAASIKGRLLGRNVEVEAPMSTVFFASGNNMVLKGDLARRIIPIALDPKMEHPEERANFAHSPLLPWVLEERPSLMVAALTILRGYFVAGRPPQSITPLGSFEEWSNLVRHALIWGGQPDPCEGRKDLEADSDPDFDALSTLLDAWYACYGTTAKTLAKVKADVELETAKSVLSNQWDDLNEALMRLQPHGHQDLNTRAVGDKLRAWQGRMVGHKRFIRPKQKLGGAAQWRIEVI
jgi:hypothetical protein